MKLTHYGRREWLGQAMIGFVVICLFFWMFFFGFLCKELFIAISLIVLIIWFCFAAFFRDPKRVVPRESGTLVSPADGRIRDIELVRSEDIDSEELRDLFQGRDVLRIGIFLSVFNVHLNRAPADMNIVFRSYKPGKYHDARDGRAIRENEQMTIGAVVTEGVSFPIAIRQISGAIARRIVCPVEKGMTFSRGDRYGMIKFGSRTELYIPAGVGLEVQVKVGDIVRGTTSILVRIPVSVEEKLQQWNQQAKVSNDTDCIL